MLKDILSESAAYFIVELKRSLLLMAAAGAVTFPGYAVGLAAFIASAAACADSAGAVSESWACMPVAAEKKSQWTGLAVLAAVWAPASALAYPALRPFVRRMLAAAAKAWG